MMDCDVYGESAEMLTVLMGPKEVLVIVVITAVIVWFAARKRNQKRPRR